MVSHLMLYCFGKRPILDSKARKWNIIAGAKKSAEGLSSCLILTVLTVALQVVNAVIARNFGRSLRIPDASLQTSVNFPRTRPLKCMEQTAFLFNLNQERTEMKNSFKITVKHIISYALFMK